MTTIVPRWEWRAFGKGFGAAEAALTPMTPDVTEEGDEICLFSGAGANVKVRDDLMDAKVLREVSADGLERWEPVMNRGSRSRRRMCPRSSRRSTSPHPGSREPPTRSRGS